MNLNNKINEKGALTRKKVQENPELRKFIIEKNIDPTKRNTKTKRSPPTKTTTAPEEIQSTSTQPQKGTEIEIHNIPEIKTELLIDVESPTLYSTPTNKEHIFFNETTTNESPNNSKNNYTDIEGILNEQSLISTHQEKPKMAQQKLPITEISKLIPDFNGRNMDPEDYIDTIKQAKQITTENDIPVLISLIRIKLTGEVKEALRNCQINNIEELISAIRQLYPTTEDLHSVYTELNHIRQLPNETIVSYANRTKKLILKIKDLKRQQNNTDITTFDSEVDTDGTQNFKRGLKPEIRIEIGHVETLQEAIIKAIRVENAQIAQQKHNYIDYNRTPQYNQTKTTACQICGNTQHEALLCNIASCLYCKRNDHYSQICNNTQKKIDLTCRFCNDRGHSIDTCGIRRDNHTYCQYCQEQGHRVEQCKNTVKYETCSKCKKTGHSSTTCTEADKCEICEKTGHNIHNCPDITCTKCNQKGHSTKTCKYQNFQVLTCDICEGKGHQTSNCTQIKELLNKHKTVCQICKKTGHEATDCLQLKNKQNSPNRRTYNRTTKTCEYCDMQGHTIEECRKLQRIINFSKTQKQCGFCKQTGHTAKECEKIGTLTNKIEKFCDLCKNIGHTSSECFKNTQNFQ